MTDVNILADSLREFFSDDIDEYTVAYNEVTIEVPKTKLRQVCQSLRDESAFCFSMLIDVCGVDYLDYGLAQWTTEQATGSGFERGVQAGDDRAREVPWDKPRFAVVYHLLSLKHNHRLRVRSFVDEDALIIDSVVDIWKAADWFEREAFDMFGILFEGHPDLRRVLTDYGFVGNPFRKDFPVSGNVEMRYDAKQGRVVYEPVKIQPRVLVPKVIRYNSHSTETPEQGAND